MDPLTYRPEDQFQERLNAERLKELFKKGDHQGLLDFALLLNYQASSANSRVHWAIREAAKNMSNEFSLEKYMNFFNHPQSTKEQDERDQA